MEVRTQLQGPNHEDTLRVMDALGESYWLHGQYKDARETQIQVADGMRAHSGPSDLRYPDNLTVLDISESR